MPPLATLLVFAQLAAAGHGMAVDARLAADAGLRVGERVVLARAPGEPGDTVVISAIVAPSADPAEIARGDYRIRLHLGALQRLLGYGDRVDRFAVAARDSAAARRALGDINEVAFGFRAWPSREIAAGTSQTFRVVSRFNRAIGVITIVASAVFLLCILLLEVEERRRDVAALRLMGLSRRTVLSSLVLEAALVSLVGSALGTGIGALASRLVNAHYQAVYRTPLRFSILSPDIIGFAVALSLVLGVGAGAVAALRLVRAEPLDLLGR